MMQPYCRFCGAKIAKYTTTIYFVAEITDFKRREMERHSWIRYVLGTPMTKAEAQALVNEQIVSVRRGSDPWGHDPRAEYVYRAGVWDGETYKDDFFCTGDHAKDFAYREAAGGSGTPAYWQAVKAAEAVR